MSFIRCSSIQRGIQSIKTHLPTMGVCLVVFQFADVDLGFGDVVCQKRFCSNLLSLMQGTSLGQTHLSHMINLRPRRLTATGKPWADLLATLPALFPEHLRGRRRWTLTGQGRAGPPGGPLSCDVLGAHPLLHESHGILSNLEPCYTPTTWEGKDLLDRL